VKVAVILGTRPEIIKMSPVIAELENQGLDYFILHTGQHYSYEMDRVFFEQLRLPEPKYNLNVGSGTHAEETGKILVFHTLYKTHGVTQSIDYVFHII
jgi:UDP-N-acetylglucosamine 2-epimerase (non-hydrolysing)